MLIKQRQKKKTETYNASYSEVKQRSKAYPITVAYNQRLCFHNANFINSVYVQFDNTQTSVYVTVKIETPSAFSIGMRFRN